MIARPNHLHLSGCVVLCCGQKCQLHVYSRINTHQDGRRPSHASPQGTATRNPTSTTRTHQSTTRTNKSNHAHDSSSNGTPRWSPSFHHCFGCTQTTQPGLVRACGEWQDILLQLQDRFVCLFVCLFIRFVDFGCVMQRTWC